jgi:hypothetical protein
LLAKFAGAAVDLHTEPSHAKSANRRAEKAPQIKAVTDGMVFAAQSFLWCDLKGYKIKHNKDLFTKIRLAETCDESVK